MKNIVKKNEDTLEITTHAGIFTFKKIGYILSKEEYNTELEKNKDLKRQALLKL